MSKKKRYTIAKNQLMVNNRRGHTLQKVGIRKEEEEDIMTTMRCIRRIILLSFPEQEVVTVVVYLGYLGIENDFSEQLLLSIHNRKKRNQELSKEEKEFNKNRSRKRIII